MCACCIRIATTFNRYGPFWLGKLGLAANILTILWTIFSLVIHSFLALCRIKHRAGFPNKNDWPGVLSLLVNLVMIYISVVYAVIIMLVDWFARGRRSFKRDDLSQKKVEVSE